MKTAAFCDRYQHHDQIDDQGLHFQQHIYIYMSQTTHLVIIREKTKELSLQFMHIDGI
jgi:hypothetical protein